MSLVERGVLSVKVFSDNCEFTEVFGRYKVKTIHEFTPRVIIHILRLHHKKLSCLKEFKTKIEIKQIVTFKPTQF